MDIRIDLGDDLKRVTRSLGAFADTQIAFATAQALNEISGAVQKIEKAELKKEFPTATPFTLGAVGLKKARKSDPEAIVYLRDIAAEYLKPYIDGGKHTLNSRALLNPKQIPTNQYGNIPRNKLASLKARSDVFIGAVKTKAGTVNGVWQRVAAQTARPAKAAKGKRKAQLARVAVKAHLKLLIRFGDALEVTQHLPWAEDAEKTVKRMFDGAFGRAMARAIATARLK